MGMRSMGLFVVSGLGVGLVYLLGVVVKNTAHSPEKRRNSEKRNQPIKEPDRNWQSIL